MWTYKIGQTKTKTKMILNLIPGDIKNSVKMEEFKNKLKKCLLVWSDNDNNNGSYFYHINWTTVSRTEKRLKIADFVIVEYNYNLSLQLCKYWNQMGACHRKWEEPIKGNSRI